MCSNRNSGTLLLAAALILGAVGRSHAIYVNKSNTIFVQGKFNTLATLRTADAPDTNMIPIDAGDLVQHRTTLIIDLKHDLGEFFRDTTVSYYVQGRAFYDGVWDYGPSSFSSDPKRHRLGLHNGSEIDDEKWDVELFQGYVDMNWGGFSARIGKQALSWGEMSVLRIFDGSNPLDNQSVGVDLEERILPLGMLKLLYATYDLPFLESSSFEGYYIPSLEDYSGEEIIAGSAIMPPIGRYSSDNPYPPLPFVEREIDDPRYGIRVGGILGDLQANLGYYRKYADVAGSRLHTSPICIDVMGSCQMAEAPDSIEFITEVVDVFGGTFNYYWPTLDVVVRGESAYYVGEPMQVEGVNVPADYSAGRIPDYDVVRYGLAFDKNVRISLLNNNKDFVLKFEYIGAKIVNFNDGTLWGWDDPDSGKTLYKNEYNNQFVFIAANDWLSGNIEFQFTSIYNVEAEALLLIPKVILSRHGNAELSLSYRHTEAGTYKGIGYLQDANEAQFGFSYFF